MTRHCLLSGALVGAKLWYNFAQAETFHISIEKLMQGIRTHFDKTTPGDRAKFSSEPKRAQTHALDSAESWSKDEVGKWIESEGLAQLKSWFLEADIDGIALRELGHLVNTGSSNYAFISSAAPFASLGVCLKLNWKLRKRRSNKDSSISVSEVLAWLNDQGLAPLSESFKTHEVDGQAMSELKVLLTVDDNAQHKYLSLISPGASAGCLLRFNSRLRASEQF